MWLEFRPITDPNNMYNILEPFGINENNPNFQIRYVYFVWCQGESDGDSATPRDVYYERLDSLTTSLVESDVVDCCMIIQTGDNSGNLELYDYIQQAQYDLCENSDYCIMISDSAKTFVGKGLMKDAYHYTQEGYNLLGEEAGENATEYSNKR